MSTPAISGPRPLTKLQPADGIAGPLHRVVLTGLRCDMGDIAKELRERSLQAEQEGEPLALLDEAADEIERLRLTDEEREALRCAVCDYNSMTRMMHKPTHGEIGAALARLFERLK
jgi:hypothetical protein